MSAVSDESFDDQFPARPTRSRWILVALLCMAALIAYLGRGVLGVSEASVRNDLGIDESWFGAVMSAFFGGYALMQVPAGWLGHLGGARLALSVIAVAWSTLSILVGASPTVGVLIFFQVLFGAAQAGIFPLAASAIARWIPTSRRAISTGLLGSFMSIGGALSAAATGALLEYQIDWRWIFTLFAVPGLIWAAIFYSWFRNDPADHGGVNEAELDLIRGGSAKAKPHPPKPDQDEMPMARALLVAMANFSMWMICGQQFFRAAGYIFYSTWFPRYLKETFANVETLDSALFSTWPVLAVVFGSAMGGILVDFVYNATGSRRLSRQGVGTTAMSLAALCILAAYYAGDVKSSVILISVGSFCAALGGSCAYAVTIEKAGDRVAPIFGIMNMSGNIGATVCPMVVAWWVVYTGQRWELVLMLFVANYACAALCWLLLNPEGSVFHDDGS